VFYLLLAKCNDPVNQNEVSCIIICFIYLFSYVYICVYIRIVQNVQTTKKKAEHTNVIWPTQSFAFFRGHVYMYVYIHICMYIYLYISL